MPNVLVCDDAADLRLLMRLALETEGHTVTEVDGGLTAMGMIDDLHDTDVVLLDVQMPAVDGWTVLQAIRNHPEHAELPVVMCTVKFSHEDLVQAWELGCDGYINKPFDLPVLARTVEEVMATDIDARLRRRQAELAALSDHANSP